MNGYNVFGDSVKEQSKANGHATPLTRPEWIDWTKGDDPKPKPTCRNVRIAIRALGIRGEYDEFRYRMNLGGQMIGQWAGELNDNAVQALRSLIQAQFDFDPSLQATRDAMEQECLDNPFHPIQNYFSSLQWDGRKRLDTWLCRYLGAQDTPFNRAVSRLSLIAAVRRILQPGCKFDQIIVLEAKEGKGKSTALQILAGVDNFSDQDILTSPKQVQQELMAGKWIYEIGELAGLHSADTTRVKAFASRQVDRGRRSYGRYAVDQLRTCIFFATTNDAEYLLSQTGNRRFWPVKCGNVDLVALEADRDQIWAEAVLAEKGASLVLPESLWDVAGEIQNSRMIEDPWLDLLEGVEGTVERTAEGGFQWRIATHTLLTAFIKIDPERQTVWHARRLVGCMRRIGWEYSPKPIWIAGASQRGFFRPATVEEYQEYVKKGGTVR